jgi:hypothetical protein
MNSVYVQKESETMKILYHFKITTAIRPLNKDKV